MSRQFDLLLSILLISHFVQTTSFASTTFLSCLNEQIRTVMQKMGMIDVDNLLGHFRHLKDSNQYLIANGRKFTFEVPKGIDVYNPTAVFTAKFKGQNSKVILGRTENEHLETGTQAVFYYKKGNKWHALENISPFEMQDPFMTKINGELIVGGVETYPKENGELGYRTVFYRDYGKGIEFLGDKDGTGKRVPFAVGPDKMKDIRLVHLKDGSILVMTRPQGEKGGRGKIGYFKISKLEDLTAEAIDKAPIIENQFIDSEWGGANELHSLPDGRVGVLGHIAKFDESGGRHYYPMSFVFDPSTGKAGPIQILLERSLLPNGLNGKSKRDDLKDVLFSGGLIRHGNGTATLFLGAGDAETYQVTIPDPFKY